VLNGERVKVFALKGFPFSLIVFNVALEVLFNSKRQVKGRKEIK
jgi:hypothetical protein